MGRESFSDGPDHVVLVWCSPLTRSGTNGYWHYEGAVLSALSAHLFVAGQGPVA